MRCDDAQSLLHAWADQELDPANSHIIAMHMSQCPSCATAAQTGARLTQAIKSRATRHKMPKGLYNRVAKQQDPRTRSHDVSWGGRLKWGLLGIAMAATACVISFYVFRPDEQYLTQRQLAASHIRSLQEDHLTDISAGDPHTVKSWFSGKSDVAPPVTDLGAEGFALTGGRLDYINDHPADVLIYHYKDRIINLFIWHRGDKPFVLGRYPSFQGYHIRHWQSEDLQFWAVSDISSDKLMDFERAYTAHTQ